MEPVEKKNFPRPPRRVVRVFLTLAAALLLWWGYSDSSDELLPLIRLNPSLVLRALDTDYLPDFPEEKSLAGAAFHREFSGTEGEVFYLIWQQPEQQTLVEKYRITASDETPAGYCFVPDAQFENMPLPSSQFLVYTRQGNEWIAP